MSFHIEPSEGLKALIADHVGPAPCAPPGREERNGKHPYFAWLIEPMCILSQAVDEALEPMKAEIEAKEMRSHGNVRLGEVPFEVLGHSCRWVHASCSPILGSYLGEAYLEAELSGPAKITPLRYT